MLRQSVFGDLALERLAPAGAELEVTPGIQLGAGGPGQAGSGGMARLHPCATPSSPEIAGAGLRPSRGKREVAAGREGWVRGGDKIRRSAGRRVRLSTAERSAVLSV